MTMKPNEITVAVGAVILSKKGEVLLVRHIPEREGYWKGRWICPGGKLKAGETIEEGIKREVKEETHLDIELGDPLFPFQRIVRSEGKVKLHVIYLNYLAKVIGGKLKPDSDVGEALWIKESGISRLGNDLHQDTIALLKNAKFIAKF